MIRISRPIYILSYNIEYICAILLHQSYRYARVNSSSTADPATVISSSSFFCTRKICGLWPVGGWVALRGWFTHDSRVFMVVLVFYWSFNKLDLACQYVYVAVVGTTTSLIHRACACVRYNVIRAPCHYYYTHFWWISHCDRNILTWQKREIRLASNKM